MTREAPRCSVEPLGSRLPDWCDPLLDPAGGADFFSSRLWYDAVLAGALPAGARPRLLRCGAATLPLLNPRSSLTTPYTLEWRPWADPAASAAELNASGRALARHLRFRWPMQWDSMDPGTHATGALLGGAAEAGCAVLPFQNFGNWNEALAPGAGWQGYLARRPSALRSTIQRKLARAARELRFEAIRDPGEKLEAGIAAYEAVRAASWKPPEPSPGFDALLMRAAAAAGLLRLGILRGAAGGHPVAAQYWIASGGTAWLLKLCHTEDSRAASPGTALTALMIRGLIEEDDVRQLDFGRGDDAYKQMWVSQRRQREGVVLASPWHPAGLLAIAKRRVARVLRK